MSGSSSEDTDEELATVRLQGDLVPRPVWTGLSTMPRIQGLAAATIDTRRARLCTTTNLHVKDGRHAGGEITLWSLRAQEAILSRRTPTPPDGIVQNTLKLFYVPGIKCYVGVGAQFPCFTCTKVQMLTETEASGRRLGFHVGRRLRHAQALRGCPGGGREAVPNGCAQ